MKFSKLICPLVFLGFALSPQLALAETCEERFASLLVEGNGDVPVEITITQEIVGGMKSTNLFRSNGHKQWMSEMIDPPNLPWSMVRDNVMYSSSDQGKSWSKVRDVDSEKEFANSRAMLEKDAATIRDVNCAEDTIDGETFEHVTGTYTSSAMQGAEAVNAYWVNADGWIARHTSKIDSPSFKMNYEQVLEKRDSVDIPAPNQ